MPRDTIDQLLNFDEPSIKRGLMSQIGTLRGWYDVQLSPKRPTRSNQYNRYYFGFVVKPFFDFLAEQHEEITDPVQAHEIIKQNILGELVIHVGGVESRIPKTTHDMDTPKFHDFVVRARAWLWNAVGIATPEPGECGVEESPTEVDPVEFVFGNA